ncbi:MAG: carboxypeptidase regulatory-like domain-containing protein [Planctomycetaceae bacterium]|nr:carboxypeptidase regulatory-like domain-containing protein [Planctomycetaceae bacterium]
MPVYPVSGKITLGGAPVANAIVSFAPQGDQPAATGKTNSSGEYQLTTYEGYDGAAEGEYVVLVTKSAGSGSDGPSEEAMHEAMTSGGGPPPSHDASGGENSGEEGGSVLPEKYSDREQTDLTANVTADGENVFNFDLSP